MQSCSVNCHVVGYAFCRHRFTSCKCYCRHEPDEVKAVPEPEDTAADKWLTSLRKSVSRSLTYLTRTANRALLKVLRYGRRSHDQAKPGVFLFLCSIFPFLFF